jgi:predicted Zn-dependent protease
VVNVVRRDLIQALTVIGGYPQYCEALALLDEEVKKHGENPDEKRLRAVLLATRPGRRAEAIRLFEASGKQSPLTFEDKFVLAQLYEASGDWPKAREMMSSILSNHGDNPRFIASYVASLLRRGMTNEAEVWLAKLQRVAPDNFETTALTARFPAARHQADETIAVLQHYVDAKPADSRETSVRLGRAARLLESLAQDDAKLAGRYRKAAEVMYARYASQSPDPDAKLTQADFLARQGRAAEAIAICSAVLSTSAPKKIAAIGTALLQSASERSDT